MEKGKVFHTTKMTYKFSVPLILSSDRKRIMSAPILPKMKQSSAGLTSTMSSWPRKLTLIRIFANNSETGKTNVKYQYKNPGGANEEYDADLTRVETRPPDVFCIWYL